MQPRWPDTSAADRADLAACRAKLRGGSRSFFAASLLLPARVRDPASALYAFCRVADDAIDLDDGHGRAGALARLHDRLDRAYRGRPLPIASDRALAQVVAQFAIPRTLLDALLEGFAWDAEGRQYEDLPALLDYAARVAGAVGAMMAVVMGVRAPAPLARACDLGVAMQLSNIARDVGEDACAGRLYLPLQWLRAAGVDPGAFLADPGPNPAVHSVVLRLLDEADGLYARADAGIAALPWACQPGIRAARLLYAEIGREVDRLGAAALSRRAVVRPARQALLAARGALPRGRPQPAREPPLRAVRYLVDAVAAMPVRPARHTAPPRLAEQAVWVIGLFERLERREQVPRGR